MSITSTELKGAAHRGPIPEIHAHHAGIATGALFACWHLVWSALVGVGWAQRLIDFVFWMHFIKPVYVVEPFEPLRALVLIVVTGIVGYVLGSVFAFLWNRMHR